MLPPVEESILQSNPKFAELYKKLSTNILNPNGSTKNHPAQKERDAISGALKTARIEAAKSQILISSLSSLDLSPPPPIPAKPRTRTSQPAPPRKAAELPDEFIELVILLTAKLSLPSSSLSKRDIALLESTPTYHSLPTHLPQLSALLSTNLHNTAISLSRILSPATNASFLHRQIPNLLPSVLTLQSALLTQSHSLALARTTLINTTTQLLALYHRATALIIQLLERSKHGPITRHTISKISLLSLQSQTISHELQLKYVQGEKIIYDERTTEALQNYMRELRGGRERLKERGKLKERDLWGYGVGREDERKERQMREIARVYGELREELQEVRRDVERLRGS
ncbi:hypothetical protein BHYA_0030g00300 [Botrytis hyacinthi]|uniref:Uncharacterized protein n=1 Tax=Botrytis hyacinthi TaxID=278943 RepID=A0A4Z1H6M0_9HELO|nr:hypothetical protein BHYA_0030g00300 [Botrytis hyacinthi]